MRYPLLALWIFYWLRDVMTSSSHNEQISIKYAKSSSANKILACSSESELLINVCLQVIQNLLKNFFSQF